MIFGPVLPRFIGGIFATISAELADLAFCCRNSGSQVAGPWLRGVALATLAVATGGAAPQLTAPKQLFLQADQITYDSKNGLVTAQGHVEISG